MITFSYTTSPTLKREIEKIDETRNKILVKQAPRLVDIRLRWESNIDRVYDAARLLELKIKRNEVADIIKRESQRNDISAYFNTYLWIDQNWFLNPKKVELLDFKKLYSKFDIPIDENEIRTLLEFIQINPEHPIVQAGLAGILTHNIFQKNKSEIILSNLASAIFLYKHGYDFRGLLNIESFILSDLDHYNDLLKSSYKTGNVSEFLEYFAEAVSISSENALKKMTEGAAAEYQNTDLFNLTDRQKEIMTLFARPGVKVSNKTVQARFKVSQITASRDLAKLHTLGLIFQGGKGRSVYYTKI